MMYHKNRLIRSYKKVGCQKKVSGWACLLTLFIWARGGWGFAESSLVSTLRSVQG